MKKMATFLCGLIIPIMIGCNSNIEPEQHEHRFFWNGDENYHWQESLCDHDVIIKDKAEHIYSEWIPGISEWTGNAHAERDCEVCHYYEECIHWPYPFSTDNAISTIIKEPTETEEGIEKFECKTCGVFLEEKSIPKLDHVHEWEYAGSADAEGIVHYCKCSKCGARQSFEHDFGPEYVSEPTCTKNGFIRKTCKECEISYYQTLEAIEHDFEWVKDAINTHIKKCSRCGTCEFQYYINNGKIGMGWFCEEERTVITEPTCKSGGKASYRCKICDGVRTESVLFSPESSNGSSKIYTPFHNYKDGKCILCNAREPKFEMIKIPGKNFSIASTEMTFGKLQELKDWLVEDGVEFEDSGDVIYKNGYKFALFTTDRDEYYFQKFSTSDSFACYNTEQDEIKIVNEYRPIQHLPWIDAVLLCNALSEKEGLTPVYRDENNRILRCFHFGNFPKSPKDDEEYYDIWRSKHSTYYYNNFPEKIKIQRTANGYRLPTMDEWVYAFKGGQDYTYSGSNKASDVARYNKYTPDAVGQKLPNGYGLYDMSGNLSEWTEEKYSLGGNYKCSEYSLADYEYNVELTDMDQNSIDGSSLIGFRPVRTTY